MRSLFSGIFKEVVAQTHQQVRARNVGRVLKNIADKPKAQPEVEQVSVQKEQGDLKLEQKAFIFNKEQEQEKLKLQYEQQFKKVEAQIEKKEADISRHQLLKKTAQSYHKNKKENNNKSQAKYSKFDDLSNVKYYSEQDLTKMIRQSKNGENLFRLYNAHKFTYTTKNLVHTLTKYTHLINDDKKNKLPKYDRRVMTLIASLQSNTQMLSNHEKALICKMISI